MITKRMLRAENAALRREIDLLRAKLCPDGHEWAETDCTAVGDWTGMMPPQYRRAYVCTRCGKRKEELW